MLKKQFLLFTALCFCFAPLKAQFVTIPDPNFATKLAQWFPSCMNGNQMDTSCIQITNFSYFSDYNGTITDLTGIEYFDSLKILIVVNGQLSNITRFPSSMELIQVYRNQLTNLPDLPLTLKRLDCFDNQLSILPTLPNNLWRLSCSQNQISSLPPLPNSLKSLDASVCSE